MSELGEINKEGSLDRIQGTKLSVGRAKYEKHLGDVLKLNEYVKGWKDMDTFLRMAGLYAQSQRKS